MIITADDFGLAPEVNAAVELAHRAGILSAASLMVGGAAAADAVRRAHSLPNLHLGLHVVLVDGAPVLPPSQIPGLVDRAGRLRCDMAKLGFKLALLPKLRHELRAEIVAQFEAYKKTGLRLDHVDAHKHFHLHPVVGREIIAVGTAFGMQALRVPTEPARVLARIERRRRRATAVLSRPAAAFLRLQAKRARLVTPDAVFGLAWSGAMTSERLNGILGHLPSGVVEIYMHPATADGFVDHATGYRYADELEALCAPSNAAALLRSGVRLGSYGDLHSAG